MFSVNDTKKTLDINKGGGFGHFLLIWRLFIHQDIYNYSNYIISQLKKKVISLPILYAPGKEVYLTLTPCGNPPVSEPAVP